MIFWGVMPCGLVDRKTFVSIKLHGITFLKDFGMYFSHHPIKQRLKY